MSKEIDILFKLIQSLGKGEKRHFKLFASRHTLGDKNKVVYLFEKLERLKHYNEKDFLRNNSKEGFVKHFAFNKHFLYKQILKSLHSFHASGTVEAEIREQIHYIEILIFKGLLGQAAKMIAKTKLLAEKREHFGLQIEVLKKERELFRELIYRENSVAQIHAHRKESLLAMEKQKALMEYESLLAKSIVEIRTIGLVRTKEHKDRLNEMIQTGLKEIQSSHPDFIRARMQTLNMQIAGHFFSQEDKKALQKAAELSHLMELNPHFITEAPKTYINALHNQVVINNKLKRYEAIQELVKKLNSLKFTSQNLKNRIFYSSHNLILSMYASTGKFTEGLELLKVMKRKLESGEVQFMTVQNEVTHDFSAACIYFGMGDYTSANKYLNKIIDRSDASARSDLLGFSMIMRMLIQFEVGKKDLLEYSVKSVYRYLKKRDRIYKFEDVMLNFIKTKTPLMNSKKEILNGFKQLHKELLPLSKKEFEKNVFENFDLVSWLESKIENRSFADVMKEKNKI